MWSEVNESLTGALKDHSQVARLLPELEAEVSAGRVTPGAGARRLMAAFFQAPPRCSG